MDNLLTVARQVAILFLLIGAGAALRRFRMLTDAAVEGLVNVLILVVTPCLIVDVFQRPFEPAMLNGLCAAFGVGVIGHLLVIFFSYLCVRHGDPDVRRPLLLAAVFSNAGFMGLPLEHALLGDAGVFYGVVYVVVFNLFFWSWGLCVMEGKGLLNAGSVGVRLNVKACVNPGTVGIALGLPLFFFSVRLPEVIGVPVHELAGMNTPLAMIVIGYCLAGAQVGRVVRMVPSYVSMAIRLVVYPLAMIVLLYPFRQMLDRNLMLAVVIASSAPVAAMVSMFAAKFGRDVDVSVAVVSGSTIISVLTMPPIIALAMCVL